MAPSLMAPSGDFIPPSTEWQRGYDEAVRVYESTVHVGDPSIEQSLRNIIKRLDLDPDSQHFSRTPERVAKVLKAYTQANLDLNAVLSDGFEDDDPGEEDTSEKTLVVQTGIKFLGLCPHHLLPFAGWAAVGYVPTKRVVGLSKLSRLVYAAGHLSPATQEHITNLVADTLFKSKTLQPKGVAVVTSASHTCMTSRGVESPPSTQTVVSAVRGVFVEIPALESKFMGVVEMNSRVA